MTDTIPHDTAPAVVGRISTLDRFLPVWIALAMTAGLLLGRWLPGLNTTLEKVELDGISLPIALGLLIMMYPVLAKVRYDRLDTVTGAYEDLLDYSENLMRDVIARIPDGRYNARTFIDGYLDSPDPALKELPIEVTLTIAERPES